MITAFKRFSFAILSAVACTTANAGVTVLGVQYQQDQPYSEFNCIWNDKTYPTDCPPRSLGCYVHVYLKNTGGSAVSINDVTVAGYSLEDSLVLNSGVHDARSIYFKWDNPPTAILNAGEPVWFKGDPATIPAGGVAQAVVRLRSVPVTQPVAVGVVTSGGTVTTNITVDAGAPQLASIGYSPDLTKVYLHWRRIGGAAPAVVRIDGVDVTANTTTVGDPAVDFGASVVQLSTPLTPMSYHVFQGTYTDGKIASAAQRAWTNKFIYASYGNFELSSSYTVADWVAEASDHGFNNVQVNVGEVGGYMWTTAGRADCLARGYGYTTGDKTKFNPLDPDMFFTNDEPDAEEANMENTFCGTGLKLPCGKSPMGILVMREIANGEALRAMRPMTPTSVNLNGTFRPENYYAWGQAMDVTQVDPYYQRRLSDVYWRDQQRIPLYLKATYIYAVSKATVTAAEPNPANILLFSCEWKCMDDNKCDAAYVGQVWPFPTPASKRIEVYYALAAGAKGMGYWWFPKGYPSNGLADQNKPTARALWKELGLLGNEIKTAAPLLVTGHPVDMPITPGPNVWARALASGTDTLILIAVNDNYYNDESGCHYTPVANATLTATLPSWMQTSLYAFQITAGGLSDVSTVLNGNQLQVNLGTLDLTRMVVLTKNAGLRGAIQARYDQQVRPGICAMAPELCANTPPSIVQQPSSQFAAPGGSAAFTVVVSGTGPLNYQWQKNTVKLNNGGHYSGCANATLIVSTVDSSDAASYRCVITNSLGSVTSAPAALVLGGSCSSPTLLNASFEGPTNSSGVSTNWVGYQRAPNPATVWTAQTSAPPSGAGVQYQQIANTSGTGGGGVRQDITGCVVGATYQISGWMRGNSVAYSTCTVKVSPSASSNWSTAIDLNPPQTFTGNYWTNFSGTVVATGTSMTLWLDGQTGGTGQNKAECFDGVTVTCLAAPPPLQFMPSVLLSEGQVRLLLSGEPNKGITVYQSSNLVAWSVLTHLVNTQGVVEVVAPSATDGKPRFYRATSP